MATKRKINLLSDEGSEHRQKKYKSDALYCKNELIKKCKYDPYGLHYNLKCNSDDDYNQFVKYFSHPMKYIKSKKNEDIQIDIDESANMVRFNTFEEEFWITRKRYQQIHNFKYVIDFVNDQYSYILKQYEKNKHLDMFEYKLKPRDLIDFLPKDKQNKKESYDSFLLLIRKKLQNDFHSDIKVHGKQNAIIILT
jgi:hypothetical protein